MPTEDLTDSVLPREIRIHGIGNQKAISALGDPVVVDSRDPFGPSTSLPPPIPHHELRLLGWSRTSRGLTRRITWHLALPFTLVNMAGEMVTGEHRDSRPRRITKLVVIHLAGVVLSLTGMVWGVAIIENFVRFLPLRAWNDVDVAVSVAFCVGVAAFIILRPMVHRYNNRDGVQTSVLISAIHALFILALGTVLWLAPPTQWQIDPGGMFTPLGVEYLRQDVITVMGHTGSVGSAEYCKLIETNPQFFETHLDPMVGTLLASLSVSFVAAGVLLLLAWTHRRGQGGSSKSLGGAALCLVIATWLVNILGSALTLAVKWILTFFDHFHSLDRLVDLQRGPLARSRAVVAYWNNDCSVSTGAWIPNDAIGFAVVAVASAAVAIFIVNAAARTWPRFTVPRTRGVLEYVHEIVAGLPARMPAILVVAFLLWIIASTGLLNSRSGPHPSRVLIDLLNFLGVLGAIVVVIFLFVDGKLRQTVETAADVIGFWPVRSHPLSGSSYRPSVIRGLRDEYLSGTGPLILVGHSQGSVISAWFVSQLPTGGPVVHLVTCGSPLRSLYESFFPAHFGRMFSKTVAANTATWTNFWRTTDPIGSPVGETSTDNRLLADPSPQRTDGKPRGHGDYWVEEEQVSRIAEVAGP